MFLIHNDIRGHWSLLKFNRNYFNFLSEQEIKSRKKAEEEGDEQGWGRVVEIT